MEGMIFILVVGFRGPNLFRFQNWTASTLLALTSTTTSDPIRC